MKTPSKSLRQGHVARRGGFFPGRAGGSVGERGRERERERERDKEKDRESERERVKEKERGGRERQLYVWNDRERVDKKVKEKFF